MAEQSHDRSCDVHPKSRDYEERIERLQVELEKKTSMLMEVRRHLHEAVEREKQLKSLSADPKLSEKYLSVVREKERLEQQVVQVSLVWSSVRVFVPWLVTSDQSACSIGGVYINFNRHLLAI